MNRMKDLKPSKNEILAMSIKEELNKLFYVKPNYDAELEMLAYQYAQEEEERFGLHASSVTGATKSFCYREQLINIFYMEHKLNGRKVPNYIIKAFRYRNAKNENNPINLARIFEEGKSIGTKWQRLFIRAGIGVKEDMDVSRFVDEYDLSYTPDAIIELNGHKYAVEIKSMNKNTFDKAKNHLAGRKQLKLYMHFEGLERGFVLADCKDNSDFKVFVETNINESDEELAKSLDILERVQRVKRKALKLKKLPPCRCNKCLK